MKYLVMETNLAYAIVLGDDGRFIKAANMNYTVGQTVDRIFPMADTVTDNVYMAETEANSVAVKDTVTDVRYTSQAVLSDITAEISLQNSKPAGRKPKLSLYRNLLTVAACLAFVVMGVVNTMNGTFASVYIKINPEVKIDINRKDIVIGIEGVNADGISLIEGYSFEAKHLDTVMNELVDRAIEQGYLADGGKISVDLDGRSTSWVDSEKQHLNQYLEEYLTEKVTVTIDVDRLGETDYGESDYGASDYTSVTVDGQTHIISDGDDGVTDYADTDYGPENDGVTEYSDTDYGVNSDGVPDYSDSEDSDTDYGTNSDGVTDYSAEGVSDYENEGITNYGASDYGA